MAHLSALEIQNWLALYTAAGLCCAFAMILSVTTTVVQLHQERAWGDIKTVRGAILFVPQTWWRWQKLYFLSTPVTLAIVGWFATTLTWG